MQISRPRRNRKSESLRHLVQENSLRVEDLIMPLFIIEGEKKSIEIESMPGQYRYSLDLLEKKVKSLYELGIRCVSLFPAVNESLKSKDAKEAYNPDGINQQAVRMIKKCCPGMLVMTDIALDPYSKDGHDGLVDPESGEVLNDETIEVLVKMALVQAQAGSDILGPSDMMDGRVLAIRQALEENGHHQTSIMAYSAKYASAFYGPFRDALDSAPKAGDKKTYQMDFLNSREAMRELAHDIEEGADFVMVKPGLSYLDIIYQFKQNSNLPVVAYNVSGEYAMVKAAAEKGWIDGDRIMYETLCSFKRAGADLILTYFAEDMAKKLNNR